MNLFENLKKLDINNETIKIGVIGAGKFSSMYLSQVKKTPGIQLIGIADLNIEKAKKCLESIGWEKSLLKAKSLENAKKTKNIFFTDDSLSLIESSCIDLIIESTGDPLIGVDHALMCCKFGKHILMVNVEADALVGPILKKKFDEAGLIYSLAYGDQPALICELVDWARTSGFSVVSAGKGTKFLDMYHKSTPDTVWDYYGISKNEAELGGMNAKMFNSFLDGTKSAIEMASVANATGLGVPDGLSFPPIGVNDLANLLKPSEVGGILEKTGLVEVISSLKRDSKPVYRDLRWGVFVVFSTENDYVKRCFKEYGMPTDDSGYFSSMYKPFHLIGLELGISVSNMILRKESTGSPICWNGDVVAVSKKALKAGDILDGEGGFKVYGKLVPSRKSRELDCFPLGLSNKVKLRNDIKEGEIIKFTDVNFDNNLNILKLRKDMENYFNI